MKHTAFLSVLTLMCILPAWALTAEQEAKLLPADGAAKDDFGQSAALDGDTAIIGAISLFIDTGAAYVFTRSGGVWTEQAKLVPTDGAVDDRFGYSVALDGDTAVIGAWFSGSAYVFVHSGGVWTEQAKLVASGWSVALDGDTAILGAPFDDDNGNNSGSAYVFTRAGEMWIQQAKLLPADGAAVDWFGNSVAINGDTAVIGARHDDDNGHASGSAYVFTRAGDLWSERAKLLPSDGAIGDQFGHAVALDGDTAVIVALDVDTAPNYGTAYVFTRSGTVWTEQAKLLPAGGATGILFGRSVALDGDTAVMGATWDDDSGAQSGSAYVFTRMGSVWTEQAKLLPADGAIHDRFGGSVALDGDTVVVGASFDDDNGDESGSAYVFRLKPDPDVPATGVVGTALLLLVVLGTGVYFTRRRAGT